VSDADLDLAHTERDPVPWGAAQPRIPLRAGLVRLSTHRELAEVHEDAARVGWRPGSWCE
jgi:hypothetical protein